MSKIRCCRSGCLPSDTSCDVGSRASAAIQARTGCLAARPATGPASGTRGRGRSRPRTRSVPAATSPPPPKQPQSMLRPRAAAEITAGDEDHQQPGAHQGERPGWRCRRSAAGRARSRANGRPQPTRVSSASGSSSYARTAATDDCGSMAFSAPAVTRIPPSASAGDRRDPRGARRCGWAPRSPGPVHQQREVMLQIEPIEEPGVQTTTPELRLNPITWAEWPTS